MAQTRKRRRRKHRGTQGGGIDRRGRRGRPKSREEARAQARRRAELRREAPPTWRSAFNRGLIGALVFFGVILLLFGRSFGEALLLSVVMLGIYVPFGYYIDSFFYRRRRAQAIRARQAEKQSRRAPKPRGDEARDK